MNDVNAQSSEHNFSLQGIFDTVCEHLFEQGTVSAIMYYEEGGPRCQYRTKRNGKILKCAIGHLISDAAYTPNIEGLSFSYPTVRQKLDNGFIDTPEKVLLLHSLQNAHDECAHEMLWENVLFESQMKENLKLVADKFDLKFRT